MTLEATYDIPPGEEPAARCPYCNRPFSSERLETFHVGRRHEAELTDEEQARFEEATDEEQYDIFTYHLKAAVSVFLVYFLFTMIYALVWSG
ncbi:MAG: hypothetical protein U5K37_03995 [Natrialbaceae archaeon]|nr:hypothetical protein [Natrialbaceae archaeon]